MKILTINGIQWFLEDEGLAEVLRDVSFEAGNRRTYAVHEWREKKVFVKSFTEKGIAGLIRNRVSSRGKREFDRARKLLALSVPAPEPLGYGLSRYGSFIVEEWLAGTSFLTALKRGEDRAGLIGELAGLLKLLKQHGIRHNDLHLDNILVVNGKPCLIDLHTMQIKRTFGEDDELSNLSHALTMIYGEMDEKERNAFFSLYGGLEIRGAVEARIRGLEDDWVKNKQKRAFGPTSRITADGEFLRVSGFEGSGTGGFVALLKEDKKVRVERMADHIRKTYRDKRRLERAWRAHVMLLYMDLTVTPQPFHLKKPSFHGAGFIAMEDLKGKGEELDRYLDRRYTATTDSGRKRFADGLAAFLGGLFKKRIGHRDLKGCNIFVLEDGGFLLLDVEDIIYRDMDEGALLRLLLQLNTTIPKKVSIRDRARFFLRLTASMKIDRKRVFADVVRDSLKSEIIYEGVGGLVRERWNDVTGQNR
jgi:tRNA A-37 threonylcarbamoyl transferase component Bud32